MRKCPTSPFKPKFNSHRDRIDSDLKDEKTQRDEADRAACQRSGETDGKRDTPNIEMANTLQNLLDLKEDVKALNQRP